MTTALLLALLLAQADAERLAELYRQADRHLASYDLDKAEPLLEEALDIGSHLGSSQELNARNNLVNLYLDLRKRDGHNWLNLAIPHLLRAIELAKGSPAEVGNQLAARLALAIIQLPPGRPKPELSPKFTTFLERWIAQIEQAEGPLSPRTAVSYQGLIYSPNGSEGQLHASHACDLLEVSTETPAPDFSALLLECAGIELQGIEEDKAIRLARLARKSAATGGPRHSYETVLSYVIEAEAQSSMLNLLAAQSALDSAIARALKSLSPENEIWERINTVRPPPTRSASRPGAVRELVRRFSANGETPKDARLQPAKPLTRVDPEYTKQARASKFEGSSIVGVLITPDGKGRVFNTYQGVPFGLGANVEKAIREWTFQPWTKDGRPVAGMSVIEVKFQVKN